MKKFEHQQLSAMILARDHADEITEVVQMAVKDGVSGERLWQSLVYSGSTMGVEKTQTYFDEAARQSVRLFRDALGQLDVAASLSMGQPDAHKAIVELRDKIAGQLKARADNLVSVHSQKAYQEYGIPQDMLTSGRAVAEYPAKQVAAVGYYASKKNTVYFMAWSHAKRSLLLDAQACKCQTCLHKLITEPIYEADELTRIVDHFGTFQDVFEGFGTFLVEQLNWVLQSELEGTDPTEHSAEVTKDTQDALAQFMRRSGDTAAGDTTAD